MTNSVYLDTNVFIDAFESTGTRSDQTWTVFQAISGSRLRGVTSELTLAELLPMPLSKRQSDLVAFYTAMLGETGPLRVVPVTRSILVETARLRSERFSLKLPDAVHLATALDQQCAVFLSGDHRIGVPDPLRAVELGPDCLRNIMRSPA